MMVYKLNDGVRLVISEKEGAYIEQDGMKKEKYIIAGAGIEIVKLIDGVRSMDDILAELMKIFGPNVEPYVLAKDLDRFMLSLQENGLVTLVKVNYPEMN